MDPTLAASSAAAHERLRHAIVRLELAPGTPVSEAQLVARFGFSKAAIRGALARLRVEGLVLAEPRRGHVIAPLTPKAKWPEVKDFCQRFALALAEAEPERFTAALSKAKRTGRIFIDYLRNQRGATAIMPYSARSRPGAPVAAPIAWAEMKTIDAPSHFHVGDAPVRTTACRPGGDCAAATSVANPDARAGAVAEVAVHDRDGCVRIEPSVVAAVSP